MAVELGARLLAHASRRCPTADFVLGEFEQVVLGQQRFDLVVSATAFHWVDPWVGYRKAAALLSPTGRLALLSHRVVAGPGTDAFDEVVRRCAPSFRLGVLHSATALKATVQAAGAENISAVLAAIEGRPSLRNDADRWFDSAKVSSVAWDQPLTSCQLLQAVAATSVWTVLPAHERAALTQGLQTMVDSLGGSFVRRRLTFLAVADRRTDE